MTGALSTSGQRARLYGPLGATRDTSQTQWGVRTTGRVSVHVFMSLKVGIVVKR